jgi:hypothetical protein
LSNPAQSGTGSSEQLRGHCLCGEVRYEATGPAGDMWYCHCGDCRKSSGAVGVWIETPGVRWLSGEDRVVRRATSSTLTRAFCSQCGTVLPAQRAGDGGALLPAGGLENVGHLRPGEHACASERLPWLPAFDETLPALHKSCEPASPAHASREHAAGAPVRGGCLCGAVAWEVEPPLMAMRVCHCSRCRRRSGSNGFVGVMTRPGTLRMLHGAAEITSWHMPGTRFYSVSFCKSCGSPAPSTIPKGSFVSAGCLEDDPGTRTQCHVFYGSRAAWVDAKDGLPKFEEFPPPDYDWSQP